MNMRRFHRCFVSAVLLIAAPAAAQGRLQQACDRACLAGIMDQYLAAMVAHDPAKAPLAISVRFTENAADLDIGAADGLWASISRLGKPAFEAIDPISGQIAHQGVAFEHDTARTFVVRLKVRDRQIVEVEQVVTREAPDAMKAVAAAWTSDPILSQRVSKEARTPRDDMRRRAESYFDAIVLSDDAISHFAACTRNENGRDTSKDGQCGADFKDRRWTYMQTIRPRRIDLIDEEQGVVFGYVYMNRRGEMTHYTKPNGEKVALPLISTFPATTYAGVMIKVQNDQVAKVQGIWNLSPFGLTASWDKDGGHGH
jgi:hypothetical protein